MEKRSPRHRLFGLLGLVAVIWALPQAALALGGDAARVDQGLASRLVMVLSSQGALKGACTGTVIARDIVLTAAHCVAGDKKIAIAYAENGSHVLQRISAKAINPGFSGKSRVSIDLALIKLESELPTRFHPVTLDRGQAGHEIGLSRQIAGFGLASDRNEASAGTLRSARVSVLPLLYPRFLRLGIGADADLSALAICTGDSGGPVMAQNGDGNVLVGVVYGRESYKNARTCGTTAQAVRIAPQIGWITATLTRWNGQPVSRPAKVKRAAVP